MNELLEQILWAVIIAPVLLILAAICSVIMAPFIPIIAVIVHLTETETTSLQKIQEEANE